MNLILIDWIIIFAIVLSIVIISLWAKKYTLGVADFLAANRCGGRYLISVAQNVAGVGVISIMARFEEFYEVGFASVFWYDIINPLAWGLALAGWVAYRYRQTRAMTMGQFYEMRYSRNFRIFAGIVGWGSGILNYGIFPAVTSRFFIYFCNIPQYYTNLGPIEINITLGIVMLVFLSIAMAVSLSGGQIAVMITDFFQGLLFNFTFVILLVFLAYKFGLSNIVDSIKQAPPGKSLINPFDQANVKGFTWIFFALMGFKMAYCRMAWQGGQGYYCAAKNAHEARMAGVLATWRQIVYLLVILLIPLAVHVILNSSAAPEVAHQAKATLETIDNPQLQTQLRVPVVLRHLLPPGLTGLFLAMMIAAAITTDDTYLHSWGSIFVQDVYMPLRKSKTPLPPQKHLKLLRYSMFMVAAFAWFFSMFFTLKDYIWMFFQITSAIYLAGAGSAIIGGLYWKRGTAAGAWGAMISGVIMASTGIILQNFLWKFLPSLQSAYPQIAWLQSLPAKFPLNGMHMFGITSGISISLYIILSLLTKPDPEFSMDKMLHRGKFARSEDNVHKKVKLHKISRIFGISDEFTFSDKLIYYATIAWGLFWAVLFIAIFIYQKVTNPDEEFWAGYSKFRLYTIGFVGTACVIWFLIGGINDLINLRKDLKKAKRNELDDGSVINHQLADDK